MTDPDTGIPDLIRRLTDDSKRLVTDEVQLAKLESKETLHRVSRGALWMALAFGAGAKRRGVAGAGAGLTALVLFLLDIVARVWQPGRPLGRLSPFHYFNPIELVSGRPVTWSHLAVLAAVGAGGMAVAYIVYSKRDL